jgi:hypothetical protein
MARERGTHGCRIVVRGELGKRFATQFEGMTLESGEGVSILIGSVVDQAEVFGLLEQVQDLGLELVSVHAGDLVDVMATPTLPDPGVGPVDLIRVSPEQRS